MSKIICGLRSKGAPATVGANVKVGLYQRLLIRKRMKRPARRCASPRRRFGEIAAPVRPICSSSVSCAARFAVIWFTALALIFQTTLATVSMAANAGQPNELVSAICGSVDRQSPSDPHDRVAAGHLKCIACVVGHSLAPPLLSPAGPALTLVGFSYTVPYSVPAPHAAPNYSRSARGPPATA